MFKIGTFFLAFFIEMTNVDRVKIKTFCISFINSGAFGLTKKMLSHFGSI